VLHEDEAAVLHEDDAAVLREDEAAVLHEDEDDAAVLREDEAAVLHEDEAAVLREDEAAVLHEDEAAVLHSLLERKGADAVLKAVRSQQEEFDGAELSWKWSLKDEHGNSGWVRQLGQGVKRSAEAVDNSGENEDEDEADDEPCFKRARTDRMREHEYKGR